MSIKSIVNLLSRIKTSSLFKNLADPIFPEARRFDFLEVELSTTCVLECFACPRTHSKHDGWNNGFLDAEVLLTFLKTQNHLKQVVFCGAYGDPIYHPRFIDLIADLNTHLPGVEICTETNGSHRPKSWWESLTRVCTANNTFSFSIDGLEDTNHLYRVNSRWSTVMDAVTTVRRNCSGDMMWKWILFKHNEHQVLDGYRLSKKLGFDRFKLVNSARHNEISSPTMDYDQALDLIEKEKNSSTLLQPPLHAHDRR